MPSLGCAVTGRRTLARLLGRQTTAGADAAGLSGRASGARGRTGVAGAAVAGAVLLVGSVLPGMAWVRAISKSSLPETGGLPWGLAASATRPNPTAAKRTPPALLITRSSTYYNTLALWAFAFQSLLGFWAFVFWAFGLSSSGPSSFHAVHLDDGLDLSASGPRPLQQRWTGSRVPS